MGGIDEVEDVLGAGHGADEARRLLEHLGQVLAFGLPQALGQHPFGDLDHDGDDSGRFAALVQDRRIVEIEVDVLELARAVQG